MAEEEIQPYKFSRYYYLFLFGGNLLCSVVHEVLNYENVGDLEERFVLYSLTMKNSFSFTESKMSDGRGS